MIAEAASPWAWVSLGCNVGHRGRALDCLRRHLTTEGVEVAATSSEVWTRPVGVAAQADFHNQVVLLHSRSSLAAGDWLRRCQVAETACGRKPTYPWGPRRADADIVLLGRRGEVENHGDPEVPHPELSRRRFWTRLIAEIDPEVAGEVARQEQPGC